MSTMTTAPTTAASVESPPPTPLHPIARLTGPVALVLGAMLAAVGMALHLGSGIPDDVRMAIAIAEDPQWLASHLFLGFGFAVVAVGAASAVSVVRGRGATLTAIGAIVTALAAIVMSLSDIAHGAAGFVLGDKVDAATSFALHQAYFEHPAILALNTGPLLITVGMVVLGAGLLRSRALPRWVGMLVLLAPIAVHALFAVSAPTYLHGLPFVVGMTALARATVRR